LPITKSEVGGLLGLYLWSLLSLIASNLKKKISMLESSIVNKHA